MCSLVCVKILTILACVFASPISDDSESITTRIVGGKPAAVGQFKYQVYLHSKTAYYGHNCGGSVITENYVLTAAHCVYFPKEIQLPNKTIVKDYENYVLVRTIIVVFGLHHTKVLQNVQIIRVTDSRHITVHRDYNAFHKTNDIALIHLPQKIVFNDHVQPIQLPLSQIYLEHKEVVATGWGRLSDDEDDFPEILRYVNLVIISSDDNNKKLYTSGIGGKSVCVGDSGGPLVYTDTSDTNVLVGITSYGSKKGCTKGHPPCFTRVDQYLDWIHDNMKY